MAPTACVSIAEVCTARKTDLINCNIHASVSHAGGEERSQSELTAKELVLDVLKKRATEVDLDRCSPGEEDAFYVADMGEVYRQHMRWKLNLGRVKPFYGKYNPHTMPLVYSILDILTNISLGQLSSATLTPKSSA